MGDSASNGLVGFLRGLLTNLGTPPVTSVIRSILVRPPLSTRPGLDGQASVIMDVLRPSGQGGSPGRRFPGIARTQSPSAGSSDLLCEMLKVLALEVLA